MSSWRTSPRVPMVLVVMIILAVLGGIGFTMAHTSSAAGVEPSRPAPVTGQVWLAGPPAPLIVTDLDVVTDSTDEGPKRESISFAVPRSGGTDFSSFADLLQAQVAAWKSHFDSLRTGTGGGLNISWQITTAHGSILGERLTFDGLLSAGPALPQAASFYTDLASGQSWPGQELLNPQATQHILASWQHLYRHVPGGYHPALVENDRLQITDIALMPQGHIRIAVPSRLLTQRNTGVLWFEFDADAAAAILSPVGLRLSEQVAGGEPFGSPLPLEPVVNGSMNPSGMSPSGMSPSRTGTASSLGAGVPASPTQDVTAQDSPGAADHPEQPAPQGPDCLVEKCVALTFDDGPSKYTEQVLDVLQDRGAVATFFVVGKNAQVRPDLLQRMAAEGHEIGNHSLNHRELTSLKAQHIRSQITATSDAIAQATGVAPSLTRPPYGAISQSGSKVLEKLGQAVVLWDVDSQDWRTRDARMITQEVTSLVQPGSIVLLHDIHSPTAAAVPQIVKQLQDEGYHLVTVSQLLGETEPGVSYYHGPRRTQ